MAGHSKWAKIKHKKALEDAKKGKVFSKYAQQITVAARDGGGDVDSNITLRLLVDKAKAASMPADNIQRAIDRGIGKGEGAGQLEEALYEGYGPEGVSVIVQVLTDNKNRTVSELRKMFDDGGGSLGESGSVSWNFEQKGVVTLRPGRMVKGEKFGAEDKLQLEDTESVMMEVMDIPGATDIENYEGDDGPYIDIYTEPKQLAAVRDSVNEKGYVVVSAELVWIPKMDKQLESDKVSKVQSFLENVDEHDDVQNIWSDADKALNG